MSLITSLLIVLQETGIPRSIKEMSSLRWLRANNTGIDAVPEEIGNLLKLVSIGFIIFCVHDHGNCKGKELVQWDLLSHKFTSNKCASYITDGPLFIFVFLTRSFRCTGNKKKSQAFSSNQALPCKNV